LLHCLSARRIRDGSTLIEESLKEPEVWIAEVVFQKDCTADKSTEYSRPKMFRVGFPELVILFVTALFLFGPKWLPWLSHPSRFVSVVQPIANKTFFTMLALLLGLFFVAELWITRPY
jgi:mttA/Hcf106 family